MGCVVVVPPIVTFDPFADPVLIGFVVRAIVDETVIEFGELAKDVIPGGRSGRRSFEQPPGFLRQLGELDEVVCQRPGDGDRLGRVG